MSSTASIAWKTIIVAFITLGLKSLAAWLSDSVALYSDAVESIINVVTATLAFFVILYASRPPDDNHPYGHEKAEYFAAMIEALLIGAAAFAILSQAWFSYSENDILDVPVEAFIVNASAGAINGVWCFLLIRKGQTMCSTALQADGWHLFSDVLSSVGVLAGILLANVTGFSALDPLLAVLIATNILWSGYRLMKTSVFGLMDSAPEANVIEAICMVIANEGDGALEAHDLRSRVSGPITFNELHLVVDGSLSVNEAHGICDRIEKKLIKKLPDSQINIHIEPEYKAKQHNVIQI